MIVTEMTVDGVDIVQRVGGSVVDSPMRLEGLIHAAEIREL